MRQVKMTAKPTRARNYVGALGGLLLGVAVLSSAYAQVTPPDAATRAAMDKRTAARTLLSSALARIGSNNSDASALLDAGRASIALEDYRAALGFLLRAEQVNPRDGAVKAALGSAMVHTENPTRALDYFGEAQLQGASERLFLSDRGLARDLLGQQDAAQRDYQLALSITPNDELTRRYALSLGISGDADRAVQMLTPQLRAQDRGAWRLRAMILAMNGRDKEATEIVNATMPPAMAQNILPYLTQMDRLNPAQQAAAAHFGRFPNGQLGPKRKPAQVASAASPPPAAVPVAAAGKRTTADKRRTIASATPSPIPAVRSPAASPAAPASPSAASPIPGTAAAGPPVLQSPFQQTIRARPESPAPFKSADQKPVAAMAGSTDTSGDAGKGAVGPGFSIANVGRSAGAVSTPVPQSGATQSSATPGTAPAAAAPLASLADIVSSIEIPADELARLDNAIGADTLAKLLDDKRKAEAAEDAKREKEAAAAKIKAEAEAKEKAEAAKKKAAPARAWVQIATGANASALATDYGNFAKKNPDLFKGKSGAMTEWGKTRRLLVGPFKDHKAAQDWLISYKKAGGDAFLFNSEAGQSVDPIK